MESLHGVGIGESGMGTMQDSDLHHPWCRERDSVAMAVSGEVCR